MTEDSQPFDLNKIEILRKKARGWKGRELDLLIKIERLEAENKEQAERIEGLIQARKEDWETLDRFKQEIAIKDALEHKLIDNIDFLQECEKGYVHKIIRLEALLSKAKEALVLSRAAGILFDVDVKSSGDLGEDTINAKQIVEDQLKAEYPDLFDDKL